MKHGATIQRVRILSRILMVGLFLLPIFLTTAVAFAADAASEGRWIDASRISYEGVIYVDSNPLDGTKNFKAPGGTNSGDHCGEIDVRSDNVATVFYKKIVNGKCENVAPDNMPDSINNDDKHSFNITMQNTAFAGVTAYRVDEDTVFMPVCRVKDSRIAGEYKNDQNCTFKIFPDRYDNKVFIRYDGQYQFQNSIDEENSGEWVDLRDNKQRYKNCRTGLVGCQTESTDIKLAANGAFTNPSSNYSGYPDNTTISNPPQNNNDSENGTSCEETGGSLTWIMCPLLAIVGNSISWLEAQMIGLLAIDRNRYDNPQLKDAWRMLRNFAYMILVPMIMVMVISTALGYEFVSAYTVKTALPRMIIATMFIALSYDINVFLVDVVQSIGHGIQNLLLNPFSGPYGLDSGTKLQDILIQSNNTGGNAAVTGAAIAGYGVAGYFIAAAGISAFLGGAFVSFILGILGVAALVLFVIFLLLTFRQLIIVLLILLAPIAILAWIFPGRDKLFSLWNKTFWLMMWFYPLIMVAVAAGKILATIIIRS